MSGRRKIPAGIIVFVVFIVVLDMLFFYTLSNSLLKGTDFLSIYLSFSISSLIMWIDLILTVLSLAIVPYGFLKGKNGARIFAGVFLLWSVFRSILYIDSTGSKTIGFVIFVLLVIFLLYLFMSSVKRYFGKQSTEIVPFEPMTDYTYGLYTLYSKLVQLKNGKTQVIYYFSKKKPKSGSPATFPEGFEVAVSKRSGLPYLRKKHSSSTIT